MRKAIRILTLILGIFSFSVFAAIIYGNSFLPDIYYSDDISVYANGIFYAKNKECDLTVSAGLTGTSEAELSLLNVFPVKEVTVQKTERRYVAIGGELIGIVLNTNGIIIAGTEKFTANGITVSPAEASGLKAGDIITEANGIKLNDKKELTELINSSDGRSISLKISRNGEIMYKEITPLISDISGTYRAGIWIKDSLGGIGTLTYTDLTNGTLASLGHAIYDSGTNKAVDISGGTVTLAKTLGVEKGISGKAGQLCGTTTQTIIGDVSVNTDKGIYGNIAYAYSVNDIYPVATPAEVHTGEAQILCTVTNGEKEFYDIEIEKTSNFANGRDMTIKITDTDLLSITGGIVQGMSGSPIIQDGMLVGAVTHVFLNEPKCGYAIYASEMLELSDSVSDKINEAA